MHTRGNNYLDLIHCRIVEGLIIFALPMIAGDLLQQFYNITDTLINSFPMCETIPRPIFQG